VKLYCSISLISIVIHVIESREEGAFVSAQLEALTSRSINFKLAIAIKLRHRNEHFAN